MNIVGIAAKNVFRNKFRTVLTVMGVTVAAITFILLRTVLNAWTVGADYAAKDRIATRHKVTFVATLPLRYFEKIKNVPGISKATYMNWFGAKDPRHETAFFASLAGDTDTFFDVYNDMLVAPDAMARWKGDKTGAIVGEALAKKMGWKVGDRVTLTGTIFPGNWAYNISGIYKSATKAVDNSTFIFHWNYMNDSLTGNRKDQIGWVASRVNDPKIGADVGKRIDEMFDSEDIQTLSMSERAMNTSVLAMFSAVLTAMDIVSLVILAIMALILGNTIAMGVRERTHEFGVLRALGFLPRHLSLFVFTEGLVIGGLGGLCGVAFGYLVVDRGMGRWIEEQMGSIFPYFFVPTSVLAAAFGLAVLVAILAAAVPAWNASRINVINALRRIG